jgi:hypothetical protein
VLCDYCGQPAVLVTGAEVYPHRPDLADKVLWQCSPCRAHVGCHRGTDTPLGRLANGTLRALKRAAHDAFDPLWLTGALSRSAAYAWLAEALGIPRDECYIGMFDEATCERVVEVCRRRAEAAG